MAQVIIGRSLAASYSSFGGRYRLDAAFHASLIDDATLTYEASVLPNIYSEAGLSRSWSRWR
jgi:hypothetical protein